MIEIKDLHFSFGENRILRGIDLSFPVNRIHVILGPSGCGKTTLMRLIAGLEKPDDGNISIDGNCASDKQHFLTPNKRNVGFVFQNLALWPHMSVQDHLRFMVEKKDVDRDKKIDTLLERVKLLSKKKRFPHQLSGGEKQRLAIARSLVNSPKYLLMDEPFSNLDLLLREHLSETLKVLSKEEKLTVLYVTHNLQEAYDLAHTITFMSVDGVVRTVSRAELQEMGMDEIRELYGKGYNA
jgi:iron(III) transport system ATP-binding protein